MPVSSCGRTHPGSGASHAVYVSVVCVARRVTCRPRRVVEPMRPDLKPEDGLHVRPRAVHATVGAGATVAEMVEAIGHLLPHGSHKGLFQRRGGLGLSIVRRVAELHRASVVFDDAPSGRGLSVVVMFTT